MPQRKEPMVNLGLRAPRHLKQEIQNIAVCERRDFTELTRIWLEDSVRQWEKKNPNRVTKVRVP